MWGVCGIHRRRHHQQSLVWESYLLTGKYNVDEISSHEKMGEIEKKERLCFRNCDYVVDMIQNWNECLDSWVCSVYRKTLTQFWFISTVCNKVVTLYVNYSWNRNVKLGILSNTFWKLKSRNSHISRSCTCLVHS